MRDGETIMNESGNVELILFIWRTFAGDTTDNVATNCSKLLPSINCIACCSRYIIVFQLCLTILISELIYTTSKSGWRL